MIGALLDKAFGVFSPTAGLRRAQARHSLKRYLGAQSNRLTAHRTPANRAADAELGDRWGADALRAWARMLVRDNAYAWGAVDTIVSSVVGCGILAQSMVELPDGSDAEDLNERRDKVFQEWCRVCDINGEFDWAEFQQIAQREMVEAGECLLHFVDVPLEFEGITRPVPLALELIEADRLATDSDTLRARADGTRIVRGIEIDALGKKVAYHVYKTAPTSPGAPIRQQPDRIPAADIQHLYRRERIGQSRGVTWFAPVVEWLRSLGTYLDNEMQASAVASCFTAAITSETPADMLGTPSTEDDNTDADGNTYDFLQPGAILHLNKGEGISFGSPGRPNSTAEPWINLMLRAIAVGTGLSYETVARDYSRTNYSSNRASQLEDRRRFRCWQRYLKRHFCKPAWHRFTEAAARVGHPDFPTAVELLTDRDAAAPVEFQATGWEWVDPVKEQKASADAVEANQSTLQDELGGKGKNWRQVVRQRAREKEFIKSVMPEPEPIEEPSDGAIETTDANPTTQTEAQVG